MSFLEEQHPVGMAKNMQARGNVTSGINRILDKPRCSVFRAAAVNVAAATPTNIIWDTLEYQTEGMWDGATAIFARTAGIYLFTAWGNLANGADATYRQFYFTKNGANAIGQVTGALNGLQWGFCSSIQLPMNAGDYAQIVVSQGSAGALAFAAATLTSRLNGFQACLISTIN